MKSRCAEEFREPVTGAVLSLHAREREGDEVVTGELVSASGAAYPIVSGIPRFCPAENYAASFGFQWQTFRTTQLDSRAGWGAKTADRLFTESGWPRDLAGERVLEAGSGMGRFTEVLAQAGARLCSFDYTAAVDANYKNNARFPDVCFAQADVYSPPFAPASFDRVICVGVLQHTPRPRAAFESLVRFLRPGGHLFIDHYRLSWRSPFLGKYWLRPLTRRLPPETLLRLVRRHVGLVYPLTGGLRGLLGDRSRSVSWALGMADYRGLVDLDDAACRELSVLDTFDALAPAYDWPRTLGAVRRWCEAAGLVDVEVVPAENGLAARARRP